jgi:uncharacterized protein (TIGR04255 family)
VAQMRHLSNAPITEAIIDFRVERSEDATVDGLVAELARRNNLGYRKEAPIFRSEFGFSLKGEEGRATADATTIGVKLRSTDRNYIAQLSVEGFTLSRLTPYESWENLVLEARRLWADYAACLKAPRITRYATRYINNLRLPPTQNLERFLLLPPNLPPGLPEALSGFLQRFVMRDVPSDATVILTQVLEGAPLDKPLPVVLDIDAFRFGTFPSDEPEVWSELNQLRRLKNGVFFGCLTEEAVALYL